MRVAECDVPIKSQYPPASPPRVAVSSLSSIDNSSLLPKSLPVSFSISLIRRA